MAATTGPKHHHSGIARACSLQSTRSLTLAQGSVWPLMAWAAGVVTFCPTSLHKQAVELKGGQLKEHMAARELEGAIPCPLLIRYLLK